MPPSNAMSRAMKLATNPMARFFPGERPGSWMVVTYSDHRSFRVPEVGLLLLLWCVSAESIDRASAEVARLSGFSADEVEGVARQLVMLGLLCEEERLLRDERIASLIKVKSEWSAFGWAEAAEHHLATWDFPFLDLQDNEGRLADATMRSYGEAEPDLNRTKTYASAERIGLPPPSIGLDSDPGSAPTVWHGERTELITDVDCLAAIASLAFGATRKLKPSWNGADLILRTSPSGGARHPTEGYVIAISVEGLGQGWYHVAVDPPALERLTVGRVDELDKAFPSLLEETPFEVKAIFVLTTVFERNMYRYREPRTFRSVHMDAGHLCATIEILAEALDRQTYVRYSCNEELIEARLGLDRYSEGFQLCIGLG